MSQVMKTPQSNFSGPIVVDPLTRIEGHLRIEVEVENGRIKDARSCGTLYRGLEVILKGRDPRDAQHFTQRTCGVCTYTHALASTRALEDAMGLTLPANATYIRNLVLGLLFMHDHMVHFYHLHALDFVDVTAALKADPAKAAALASSISPRKATADDFKAVQARLKAFVDSGQLGPFTNAYFLGGHPAYYLDPEANLVATAHYLEALRVQVSAAKAMAVFGAKNPHPQFLIPGGVTCYESLTPERIKEFRDLYLQARKFIEEVYIPDLLLVAGAYKDWAALGCGCRNFMAFGEFPEVGGERDITKRWLKPGVLLDGKLDFIYLNGQRLYHEDTCASLLKTQRALNARALAPYDEQKPRLEAVIRQVMAGGRAYRFRLRAVTSIADDVFAPDTRYRIHLPIPAQSMQQSAAEELHATLPILYTDAADAPQRTAYMELCAHENAPLVTEYAWTQCPRYVNPLDETARGPVYPDARPVQAEDLAEQAPHICFTPYLRSLAAELRGSETDPVRIARRFYDFITTQVMYAYQRPYLLIEGGAEYTAVNLRGDCGLQALLFITLCRISGVPARWQSGLYAAPGDVGSHDWAEFYSDRLGWLPVDCSFGGSGYRHGSQLRWRFYFGNLDPWRMVANRSYYAPFSPRKRFARCDPYDNQRGEIETDTRGLGAGEFRTRYEMIDHQETEE